MFDKVLKKIFGTRNERELRKLVPVVEEINSLEPEVQKLTNEQLAQKTPEFKERLENGETMDDIMPEAFAVVREVAKRTINMRHFDVQLMGGIVLHQGKIAEMKTGEGKTLVATLPIYLNALDARDSNGNPVDGKGVQLVTVNDYLAKRDALWMGPVYLFLGLTVGVIQHDESFLIEWESKERFTTKLVPCSRKEAYLADITYGTNNEFGFDYLRDNMKYSIEDIVQRGHNYAIVDEVDSILIDEARTPLIISGPSEESTSIYYRIDDIVRTLKGHVTKEEEKKKEEEDDSRKKDEDYEIDEKTRTVVLTERGIARVEKALKVGNLYDIRNMNFIHMVYNALKAHSLFKRDKDYIVKDGKVIIVDEFTGRLMPGRRYSEGLHQALEAKERVKIQQEYQTLASITFQNYFRMYKKLAGMTGTAATEAAEFSGIYNLDVIVIPTNMPMIRKNYPDVVYRTEDEKWDAVVKEIEELNRRGQPVLVGTLSIEKSEHLSRLLSRKRINHVVLNAKYHEREAEVVAQAGRVGAVTVATNMAGRGTDIILGGNPEFLAKEMLKKKGKDPASVSQEEWEKVYREARKKTDEEHKKVIELGGLFILGTERHESRRIDNQLRGRSGRQGDPGENRFYLSLEDELMRIFGSDRISGLMRTLGMEKGVPIESRLVSKTIERAQKQVEGQNFSMRKHVLEYDEVMNKQREVIYGKRREILEGKDLGPELKEIMEDILSWLIDENCKEKMPSSEWNWEGLEKVLNFHFMISLKEFDFHKDSITKEELKDTILKELMKRYDEKRERAGKAMKDMERFLMLQLIDKYWKDHLLAMDHLREGIGLRGYGQRDPLIEYKKEGFRMFTQMLNRIEEDAIRYVFLYEPISEEEMERIKQRQRQPKAKPVASRKKKRRKHG